MNIPYHVNENEQNQNDESNNNMYNVTVKLRYL